MQMLVFSYRHPVNASSVIPVFLYLLLRGYPSENMENTSTSVRQIQQTVHCIHPLPVRRQMPNHTPPSPWASVSSQICSMGDRQIDLRQGRRDQAFLPVNRCIDDRRTCRTGGVRTPPPFGFSLSVYHHLGIGIACAALRLKTFFSPPVFFIFSNTELCEKYCSYSSSFIYSQESSIRTACQLPFSTISTAMVISWRNRLGPQLPGLIHSLPSLTSSVY